MRKFIVAAAAIVAIICSYSIAKADGLSVRDAWARASAGPAKIGAAYLVVSNGGSTADRLVSASSPVARAAELHTTIEEGDVMRMQRLDGVDLAPGASAQFKPGGMHIMLVDLAAPLKVGTKFPLTLIFASGVKTTVDVAVLGPGAMGPQSAMHIHE